MLEINEYIYPTTKNQTSFSVVNTTTIDAVVYRNGNTIQNYNLINGQIVITGGLLLNEFLRVKTISDKTVVTADYGNPYLKRYETGKTRLMYNQRYTGDIIIDSIPVSINFTSRYDPFYTAAKNIRTDLQDIVTITDDELNYLIWDNSYRVLVSMQGSGDLNYNMPTPTELSNPNTIPYNIQQYVRYSVELDILNAMYIIMTGKVGRISKTLGDMVIDKTITLPKLDELLKAVREKLNQFTLNKGSIKTVVKGNASEPWPIIARRSF